MSVATRAFSRLSVSRGLLSTTTMTQRAYPAVVAMKSSARAYVTKNTTEEDDMRKIADELKKVPLKNSSAEKGPAAAPSPASSLAAAAMAAAGGAPEAPPPGVGAGASAEAGEGEKGGEGEAGARPEWAGTAKRADYQGERDRVRTRRLLWGFGGAFMVGAGTVAYMARNWEGDEYLAHLDAPNGYTPSLMYQRVRARYEGLSSYYSGPAVEMELPPPPKDEAGRPSPPRMTLLVGVEDVLVHSEWTRQDGWKTYMRPGWNYFLTYLAQYYEIVLFSTEYMSIAERMIMKMDPYHAFMSFAMFRESTSYIDGKIVKDIGNINRDLGKVIMLDWDADMYSRQPHNAVPIPRWTGDKNDKELVRLLPLLEFIGATQPRDVREVLKTYEDTPDYAAEYFKREQEQRELASKRWEQSRGVSNGIGKLGRLFGLAPPVDKDKPVIFQDIIREEGKKQYEHMHAYLMEHGDKMLAAEKEREKEILSQAQYTLGTALEGIVNPQAAAERMEAIAAAAAAAKSNGAQQ
ncbi:HAD-like domain-containing protein [Limtongia smithiae]|uniref:HAD-like domain-containing protein n=1 Tax=Limtongia smithiae TaxID=1125753 RepID=UPI0034D014A9